MHISEIAQKQGFLIKILLSAFLFAVSSKIDGL